MTINKESLVDIIYQISPAECPFIFCQPYRLLRKNMGGKMRSRKRRFAKPLKIKFRVKPGTIELHMVTADDLFRLRP